MNIGFDKEEIAILRAECAKEGKIYVMVDDEEELGETGQVAHFQFVGFKHNQEVIYDVLMTTLEMEYELELYDTALEAVSDQIKNGKLSEEDAQTLIEETMNELEEEEEVKVAEHLDIDEDFEYGIGVEYVKNVPQITEKEILLFIKEFSENAVKLDKTLYSFAEEND